jgi:branched-chain amino acid transport system permease protein
MNPELILSLLVLGLATGAIYALIALGYTMVYGIIELINFAHGDIFMIGTLLSLTMMNVFGINASAPPKVFTFDLIWKLAIGCLACFLICAVLGVVIERLAYRPLRNAPRLAPLISAIGVSLILQDGGKLWKGISDIPFPSIPLGFVTVGSVRINFVDILVIILALVLMLALQFLVTRTRMGKAMRAVAQDRDAAALMGVNVNQIISLTFFIGAGLAGAAAFIYSIRFSTTKFTIGYELGLIAFTCAVLGGIGNIVGAMLGGLVIGLVGAFVSLIPPSVLPNGGDAWRNAVIFAILILILVFRPSGILGQQVPEKV